MARSPALERQLSRVRRRLFLATLLTCLAWSWVLAVGLAAGWFLLQPVLLPSAAPWLRWAVLGGLVGACSLGALVLGLLRRPSPVSAALALDERFGLRERATTTLTLRPDEESTPAGQALLVDVETKVATLRVGDRFPVALPWRTAALLPLGLACLLLLTWLWHPKLGGQVRADDPIASSPEAREEIDKQVRALARKPERKPEEKTSRDLEKLQEELEKFIKKPRDTEDDVRERVKDATALEEQIRKQQKAEADRIDALKEQMKQIDRLKRKGDEEKKKDGPGKDLEKAVNDADFKKVQEEAENLSRKLQDQAEIDDLEKKLKEEGDKLQPEERQEMEERLKKKKKDKMSDEERQQLQEQIEDLKDKLERLTRDKDEAEKDLQKDLEEKLKKGEIDKEELDRELEEFKKNKDQAEQDKDQAEKDKQDLKDAAEKLGECQQCMKEGKDGEAAKKLGEAGKKMGQCDKDGEQQALQRQLAQVQRVRKTMSRAVNQGGPGAGRRPLGEEKETGSVDRRERTELDRPKEVIGTGPVGGFKGPRKPDEIREEIRQAAQTAPAALDRQRLPPSAKKMARDYFERVHEPGKQP